MVLIILAAAWAAVLLPPRLQSRRLTRPSASVVDFRQQLAVLQRAGDPFAAGPSGRRPLPRPNGMTRLEATRRRRDVFLTLLAASALTLLLALVAGGAVWLLHLTVDALLLGFTALLMERQQRRLEAQAKVRRLPTERRRPAAAQPALLRHAAR